MTVWVRFYRAALSSGVLFCTLSPLIVFTCDLLTINLNHVLNPLTATISEYAIGSFGWLEKIGITLIAISFILLSINVIQNARTIRSKTTYFSGAFLSLVGFGFFTIILFNVNTTSSMYNPRGMIHILAVVSVSVLFPISCLLLSFEIFKNRANKTLAVYTALTGLIGIIAIIWIAFPGNRVTWIGLAERLLAGSNIIWVLFAGPKILISSELNPQISFYRS